MAARPEPFDEQQMSRPDVLEWWQSGAHGMPPPWVPMEERMIHRYLSEQAFFDWGTKNGLSLRQSNTDRQLWEVSHNRQAFEERLRNGRGSEYLITGEPQQVSGEATGVTNGVWNIRKQNREKRRDDHGRLHDELETLGTYYIVGANVYQAPSVADVVGNRLLSATTSLSKFYETAASLSSWSPATGYTYPSRASTKQTAAASDQASPAQSREGSVAPAVDGQSLRSGSVAPDSQYGAQSQSNSVRDAQLLAQSLQMSIQFGDEYMDENPIIGEPGHLTFQSSSTAIKKRKADEEAAAEKAAKLASEKLAASLSPTVRLPQVDKVPSPPAIMTEAKAGAKAERDRKSKMGEKAKRRKSRPNAHSPATPSSATSTTLPNSIG